jgi:uncharacterized protein
MPATLTYPGVYIEEIPSGVRTITGVATSITAFIGRTIMGDVNEPTTISNFGDFEREFGGLSVNYPVSYAVRDFYLNGGSQAVIVRLYKPPATASDANAHFSIDGLNLAASSPGKWGQQLRATIDVQVSDEVAQAMNLAKTDLFNFTVRELGPDGLPVRSEQFRNLTVKDSARRIDRVLKDGSNLLRFNGDFPATPPDMPKVQAASDALKKLNDASAALATAMAADPPVQADIDAAKAALTKAQADYDTAIGDLDDPATKAQKALTAALQAKPQVPADITKAKDDLTAALSAMKGDDGGALDDASYEGSQSDKTGLFALDKADLFNLLCIPPDSRSDDTSTAVYQAAMVYCQSRRAMLIVDSPAAWSANKETAAANAKKGLPDLGLTGEAARNAALYFPRVIQSDPNRDGQLDTFVPCGIVAGIMARTDTNRGVWKAPAGLDASLTGIAALQVNLNDAENGTLNPLGINCLRFFGDSGRVVWGARTLRGADQLTDEYKYIPVRRLALYIEESLYRSTQWVVFEPNDEPLWAQIRLNVGAFMHGLFRQGAFQGQTPKDAYFVKCDKETTPQDQINLGIVNIIVGFAPLKPAEFVVIQIQQMAGQIET